MPGLPRLDGTLPRNVAQGPMALLSPGSSGLRRTSESKCVACMVLAAGPSALLGSFPNKPSEAGTNGAWISI